MALAFHSIITPFTTLILTTASMETPFSLFVEPTYKEIEQNTIIIERKLI